jgi:hypothetical protein
MEIAMPKEAIQLNADKVKLHIARRGTPIKRLLDGMNEKTVHRIKAGRRTSPATAHKLAKALNTTVEDLMEPVKHADVGAFLPQNWIYDEAAPSNSMLQHLPFWCATGGGEGGYLVGPAPVDFMNPLSKMLEWHQSRGRKILLRQENQSFAFEIQYFDYSPDRKQEIRYNACTICRFFPVARSGDNFAKATLNDILHRYVWTMLREMAMENAEILAIEGHNYPAHPSAYLPLVRFDRGATLKRESLGARLFTQLHGDLRWSLINYLESVEPRKMHATTTSNGIVLIIDPPRITPEWEENTLRMHIELVYRTRDGRLAAAPWRRKHREEFATALQARQWNACFSNAMPLAYPPADIDDDPTPVPFTADPDLSAADIRAINKIEYLDPFSLFLEAQYSMLIEQGIPETAA